MLKRAKEIKDKTVNFTPTNFSIWVKKEKTIFFFRTSPSIFKILTTLRGKTQTGENETTRTCYADGGGGQLSLRSLVCCGSSGLGRRESCGRSVWLIQRKCATSIKLGPHDVRYVFVMRHASWFTHRVHEEICVIWVNVSFVHSSHLVRQVGGKLTHIKANGSRISVICYLVLTICRNTSNIGIWWVQEWIWVEISPKLEHCFKKFRR